MRIAGRTSVRATAATVAAGALAAGAFALMSSASASPQSPAARHGVMGIHVVSHRTAYSFRTVDNAADLTFNQLLGISNQGVIAGYFGSGAHGCMSQGPVKYMLMDFTANSRGQIVHEVRTVTGVTSPLPATGWYLSLHQGNSNNIVANGQPTVNFRPLLCAGL